MKVHWDAAVICQESQFPRQVRVETQGTSTKGLNLNLRVCFTNDDVV